MSTDIYQFRDYREFLRDRVASAPTSWGQWAKLAHAAGCQAPYLSQVIKEKAHLTTDHVIGIAEYFSLSPEETEYFLLLLEHARAGTARARSFLNRKLIGIRKAREDIARRLHQPRLEIGEKETLYYSAWYWAAIHIAVSIPQLRTTDAISRRLMLPRDAVEDALNKLEVHKIVRKVGSEWEIGTADVHIPKDSLLIGVHHNHWRQRAITDATMPFRDNVHYTGVHSISIADYQILKARLLDFISQTHALVSPSKEEELICFACDLFVV